ncbi:hypothetical protein M0R45_037239 [Rubus argutus]|uniref:PsbP C-terminal domain-containing protein n=1 Tax=Rubus argutus TaxID=59490 RepID=A0AAW1W1R9_RUBAR
MAILSSLSFSWVSTTLPDNKLNLFNHNEVPKATSAHFSCKTITCSGETASNEESYYKRRPLLLGVGAATTSLLHTSSLLAEGIPEKFRAYVDKADGYSYYYPSDWRDFDFRAHDSAFKDRYMQLHNVRVRFIPTEKSDIHDLGPLEEVVPFVVRHKFAAPNQVENIFDMKERTIDGKNYYTFEYGLTSPNFATTSFATIAIGNGRYYTLIVGANERRWKRYRNQLKVVADSFRMLDI